MAVSVNGRITAADDAVISVFDHGFLFGEGIYETLRTYNGHHFLFERHMARMRQSAEMLDLTLPFTNEELARQIVNTTAAAALGSNEAYVRVLVTRGIGDITYDPGATPAPSVVIIVGPLHTPPPEAYADGVRIALVDVVRNHPDSVNPMIKSNNLLNSAFAHQQALRQGAFEGLMRNYRGELAECTTSNIFVVTGGVAATPPLSAGLLPGITRHFLFDIGREVGITVEERTLGDDDLLDADEAFLTSTTREIVPVVQVDDRTIGAGTPGPVTRRLLQEFRRRAQVPQPLTRSSSQGTPSGTHATATVDQISPGFQHTVPVRLLTSPSRV